MRVAAVDMESLVSQAEREGITLAEIISRELTSDQMQDAQDDLTGQMARNYQSIEDFLSDVDVPSSDELFEMTEEELEELQAGLEHALSDDLVLGSAD
jgi:hypothetical protein